MRKNITLPFLLLGLFLFFWINLPNRIADGLRSVAVLPFHFENQGGSDLTRQQIENETLRNQLKHVYEWLSFEQKTREDLDLFRQKRLANLKEVFTSQLYSIPAQVIYRNPSSWSSSLWINVGQQDNVALGRVVVAKNSPVLSDGALVGVVEYVGKKQARVRLITDSGLSPAVRVHRGELQNREMVHQIKILLNLLEKREDLGAGKEACIDSLKNLKEICGKGQDGYDLAKGEVHGSSSPIWRSKSPLLKGIGFNLEYADMDIPKELAVMKEGDLLLTSGLDGVFPMGLKVGTVLKVTPPKTGGFTYETLVRPMASRLNDLETVVILPPISE